MTRPHPSASGLPLVPGQRGEAVRDLQRRLGATGHLVSSAAAPGQFCAVTLTALRSFQQAYGLRGADACDADTWKALVEASWKLGDRPLLLTSPNMRGDDVSELQSRLARLGFDSGRVDGIFGPRTGRALADFQSNCGIVADAVCGPETIRSIALLSSQTGDGPGVSALRDRERLVPASLESARIVVGQFGGLSALTRSIGRDLRHRGAQVMSLDEPDPVTQALAANHFGADVYLGFEGAVDGGATAHFYRVPTFESSGGRVLAEHLATTLTACNLATKEVGMRLPVLRETRMPAVLVVLGPVRSVTDHARDIASATVQAIELWMSRAT